MDVVCEGRCGGLGVEGSHVETLVIYKLGFDPNYYTFALILLIKIVMCSKFH